MIAFLCGVRSPSFVCLMVEFHVLATHHVQQKSEVVCHVHSDNNPYLFSSDFIGAPLLPDLESNGFVAAGTCTEQVRNWEYFQGES